MGIRYFDLRVCRTKDKHLHSRSPFTFTHGLLGHLARDGLEEINEFLGKHPKEIVLLDFNHFYDFNEHCGHDQLIHLIHEVFGKKLCTTARTIQECTLDYLWNHQQQVILLYEQNADQCTAYMDRIGHFFKVRTKTTCEKMKFSLFGNRFVNPHGRIHHVWMISFISSMRKSLDLDQQHVSMLFKDKSPRMVVVFKVIHSVHLVLLRKKQMNGCWNGYLIVNVIHRSSMVLMWSSVILQIKHLQMR